MADETGLTSFLNSGNVNVVPSASTTQTVLPEWYTNYGMQILANQNALMDAPYQTYQGPRVAGFTPDQQAGFDATKDAAFSYQPGLNAAQGATAGLMNAPGGLETAQPYLSRAGQTSASQVQQYMNPYQDAVVNRIGELGARTLREQILPEISDRFIKSGQFGGSRQAEMIGRGIRDTMEGITAKQAEALSTGYTGALSAANTDLSRIGNLAGTAGSLGAGDIASRRATAAQMGDMAARQQSLGLTGAGALSSIGDKQREMDQANLDVAYQDFLKQQGYPQEQIDKAVATMQGVKGAVPTGTLQYGYGPEGATQKPPEPTDAQKLATLVGTGLTVAEAWKKIFGGP
jgi:hypothetical protein